MITGSRFSNTSAVILLLCVSVFSTVSAKEPTLSLPIEGLENTVLEEVSPGGLSNSF